MRMVSKTMNPGSNPGSPALRVHAWLVRDGWTGVQASPLI